MPRQQETEAPEQGEVARGARPETGTVPEAGYGAALCHAGGTQTTDKLTGTRQLSLRGAVPERWEEATSVDAQGPGAEGARDVTQGCKAGNPGRGTGQRSGLEAGRGPE